MAAGWSSSFPSILVNNWSVFFLFIISLLLNFNWKQFQAYTEMVWLDWWTSVCPSLDFHYCQSHFIWTSGSEVKSRMSSTSSTWELLRNESVYTLKDLHQTLRVEPSNVWFWCLPGLETILPMLENLKASAILFANSLDHELFSFKCSILQIGTTFREQPASQYHCESSLIA